MVYIGKLTLSPRTLAANRDQLYAHVPVEVSREQYLKNERERKQAYRDRKKAEKLARMVTEVPTVEARQAEAVQERQDRPDVELTVEIIRD